MNMESSKKHDKKFNHLINEKSPYLIQHADNPVDWYPWSDEAFLKAKKENKPIFLSIGYSTCHWCHVMAHESFEDEQIGKLMNDTFVSIKVDREERPDLDNIYMTVCQIMTGAGGWPLTILMTPDKKPFFAGTYFPKETQYGRIGVKELTLNVKELWNSKPEEIQDSAEKIIDALKKVSETSSAGEINPDILDKTYKILSESFDEINGGFGSAPKFPTAHNLLFLLRYWKRTENERALRIVEETLDSMRNGGIYDHIGFGFHRYSVDSKWLVPHFEKMLYDQALIANVYIEAYQATKNDKYKKTALEIFEYILRDMKSPKGAFYSAEDADSEGVEGKFYVWSLKEINDILNVEDAKFASKVFGITEEGNFSEEATGEKSGANIIHMKNSTEDIAEIFKISGEEVAERIERIREKLFNAREKRIRPHKDDKILTDWNGLMIAAFAKGAWVFGEEKYLKEAQKAADFIINTMCENNRLFHRYRDGEALIAGNLDDYAFLIYGLLEIYQASFESKYLKTALSLNKILLKHFWDVENGGFYFTPDDGEEILIRKKEIYDAAIPSGNSIQMLNLLKISQITEDEELKQKITGIEKAFSETILRSPTGFTQFMVAFDYKVGPSHEIVIVGNPDEEKTKAMIDAVKNNYIPNKTIVLRPLDETSEILELIPSLKFKTSEDNKSTAYICSEGTCKAPTNDSKTLLKLLNA